MTTSLRARAEARLEEAIAARGIRDPRRAYRERLRALRESDPAGFERALRYFEETLVPRIADQAADPVAEWLEYGRLLGELSGPGRLLAVDRTGRAQPLQPPGAADDLAFYLPDETRVLPFALQIPSELSDAQQATMELLLR